MRNVKFAAPESNNATDYHDRQWFLAISRGHARRSHRKDVVGIIIIIIYYYAVRSYYNYSSVSEYLIVRYNNNIL